MLTTIASIFLLFLGFLLIFVILLQRGRGGGLAGAFGGAGGQSAFGTKAGDVFTRITIGIAIVWVLMAVLTGYAMTYESGKTRFGGGEQAQKDAAATEGEAVPIQSGGAPNPFEAGTKDKNKTAPANEAANTPSSKEASKTPAAPQTSAPGAAGKTQPATKTTPPTPPATK